MAQKRKPWTDEEITLLRENYRAKGQAWCSEKLGRPKPQIAGAANRHGIARPRAETLVDWSAPHDLMIRRAYASKRPGAVKACADALGRPATTIQHRAAQLGLVSRRLGRRMEPERVAYIREHCHLAPARIAEMMRRKGWNVQACRVRNLIKHEGWAKTVVHRNDEIMTTRDVEEALGVSKNTVCSWIQKGHLRAEKDRTSATGEAWLIQPKYLARMLGQHPSLLIGRDVDIVWLVAFLVQYGFYGRGGDDRDLYPRVVALKREQPHLSHAEIAVQTGAGSSDSVATLISKARRAGELPPVSKAA